MNLPAVSRNLQELALDLRKTYPRSPRAKLAGYVIAARVIDKCRATLAGKAGEYKYECTMSQRFFDFAGIDSGELKEYVATGATDPEIEKWIGAHARNRSPEEIVFWNNQMRDLRVSDLPPANQAFLERYIVQYVPSGRVVYRWFDVYDLEEGRL